MAEVKKILIRNGSVFDPAQGWRGEVHDLYMAGGKVSEPFNDPEVIIDADMRPVLAGGIDPFCHLALPGQIFARIGSGVPSLQEIGETYARMGYVHGHQPFVTLLTAGAVWHVLDRIPYIDTSASVVIDLRDMGKSVRANNYSEFEPMARALIDFSGSLGLFLPFPYLRHKHRHYLQKNISTKKIFEFLSGIKDPCILPVSLWGMPGLLDNEIPSPPAFHISGLLQALESESAVERAGNLLDAGGSADLGLISRDTHLTVVRDPLMVPGSISIDIGINSPLRYDREQIRFNSASSLNGWHLLGEWQDTWHLSLSSPDCHGGAQGHFSEILVWLLDPHSRPPEVDKELKSRTFDLYDIARMTRLEPARYLGLDDLGHLAIGAAATVAVYDAKEGMPPAETARALADCWCLIKDGVLVRTEGKFTGIAPLTRIRHRTYEYEVDSLARTDLLQNPSVRWEHLRHRDQMEETGLENH